MLRDLDRLCPTDCWVVWAAPGGLGPLCALERKSGTAGEGCCRFPWQRLWDWEHVDRAGRGEGRHKGPMSKTCSWGPKCAGRPCGLLPECYPSRGEGEPGSPQGVHFMPHPTPCALCEASSRPVVPLPVSLKEQCCCAPGTPLASLQLLVTLLGPLHTCCLVRGAGYGSGLLPPWLMGLPQLSLLLVLICTAREPTHLLSTLDMAWSKQHQPKAGAHVLLCGQVEQL